MDEPDSTPPLSRSLSAGARSSRQPSGDDVDGGGPKVPVVPPEGVDPANPAAPNAACVDPVDPKEVVDLDREADGGTGAGTKPEHAPVRAVRLWRSDDGGLSPADDRVAVEEPLTIRLAARGEGAPGADGLDPIESGERRTVALTMRTPGPPGEDGELALGFLYGEGLLRDPGLVDEVRELGDAVEVGLAARRLPETRALDRRRFVVSSACGVCGREGLPAVAAPAPRQARASDEGQLAGPTFPVGPDLLLRLPGVLEERQSTFAATGGLHAAALFDLAGTLVAVREDVGRHNALDKLVGHSLVTGLLAPGRPLDRHLVLVSGRASYELVQKAVAAGVSLLAAVSAPSSLAVELAQEHGLTLVGFLRGDRFNVYAHPKRIGPATDAR